MICHQLSKMYLNVYKYSTLITVESICVIDHLSHFINFQLGFKEGAYDGREAQFQRDFDTGFECGFKNGFELGKYRAIYENNSDRLDIILNKPSRGQCVVCTDSSLKEKSTPEITATQEAHIEKCFQTLDSRYKSKIDGKS